MGTAIKHPVRDRVKSSFVIFYTLTIWAERQSARMSKITNYNLTRYDTGCFIASCTHMATVGVNGLDIRNRLADLVFIFKFPINLQSRRFVFCIVEVQLLRKS